MNKLVYSLCLFFIGHQTYAQQNIINMNSYGSGYTAVFHYGGIIAKEALTIRIENRNNANLDVRNWRLGVLLQEPIYSAQTNKTFPADKIRFIPSHTTGQMTPGPLPPMNGIGANPSTILDNYAEVLIVPLATAPLYQQSQWGGFYNLNLHFDIELAGGVYLAEYPLSQYDPGQYLAKMQFILYNEQNQPMATSTYTHTFHIGQEVHPANNPTIVYPSFSLYVSTEVRNGRLDLVNQEDYKNGVSVTYPNGLGVKAGTSYVINVRAVNDVFFSTNNLSELPLDVIRVQAIPHEPENIGHTITLSSSINLPLMNGPGTDGNTIYADIRYFTVPDHPDLNQAMQTLYSNILFYSIIPQ